jgi:hypothetical protein
MQRPAGPRIAVLVTPRQLRPKHGAGAATGLSDSGKVNPYNVLTGIYAAILPQLVHNPKRAAPDLGKNAAGNCRV